jgi:hypothetical protein
MDDCSDEWCWSDSAFNIVSSHSFHTPSGTDLECQYALMTFGIPIKNFPVTTSGLQKFEHTLWCIEEERRQQDFNRRAALQGKPIFAPTSKDVLCGRGKPFQEHTGNIDLAATIEDYNNQYKTTKRGGKADICEEIVDCFQSKGGRFLKRLDTTGEWEEVSNDAAREKVSQGFRNMFKKHMASTEDNDTSRRAQMKASSSCPGASEQEDVSITRMHPAFPRLG